MGCRSDYMFLLIAIYMRHKSALYLTKVRKKSCLHLVKIKYFVNELKLYTI